MYIHEVTKINPTFGEERSKADVIIVGAGASGCVLAARLVEAGADVILIEAGPDLGPTHELPASLTNPWRPDLSGRLDWGLTVHGKTRIAPVPRGRLVGGSAAINSAIAMRPDPDDFREWAQNAGPRWEWERVLPYFVRLETDLDAQEAPYHGGSGPIPIKRWGTNELEPISHIFYRAMLEAGYENCGDLNAPGATGIGTAPMNRDGTRRISSAAAYLDPVRGHPNLTILAGTTVDRVVFHRGHARGVTVEHGSARPAGRQLAADTIVLSAGAYATPAILLRSGVGDEVDLKALGINIEVPLPGVGKRITDHSQFFVPATGHEPDPEAPSLQVIARVGSKVEGGARNDMQFCVLNSVDTSAFAPGEVFLTPPAMFCVLLHKQRSEGRVLIAGRSGEVGPLVELEYLDDPVDLARYRWGVRELSQVMLNSSAASDINLQIDERSLMDDVALDQLIHKRIQTGHHPTGSARMGRDSAGGDVVDDQMKVFGVDGLYAIDASVIPVALRANINLTCLMLAEVGAEVIAGRTASERSDEVGGLSG